jgi:hypothetical protein
VADNQGSTDVSVKLSAYIIRVDSGFAPNPFGHHCTLACCKPTIRRKAEIGDIVLGTAAAHYQHAGRLVYGMKVSEILSYQEYWDEPLYAYRKPSSATSITRRGDNVWHRDASGHWQIAPGAIHNESHKDHDLRGEKVLISTEFFYFGRDAIQVPEEFLPILATTQGHKNNRDPGTIGRFWDSLSKAAPKPGRNGDPSEFTDEGCRAQCSHVETDDCEE